MKKEIIIGIATLLTIVLSIWGFQYLKGTNILKKNISIQTIYDNVQDLEVASEVFVNGFKVGTVTDIELDPEDVSRIIVTYEVGSKIRVPKSAIAAIKNTNIMGGKHIELLFEKMCTGDDCVQDGSFLKGTEVGLLGSMVDISEFSEFTNIIGDKVSGGSDSTSVDPKATLKKLDATIENLVNVTSQISNLLEKSNASLTSSFANLASITKNVANNNAKVEQIIRNVEVTTNKLSTLDLNPTISKANETVDVAKGAVKKLEGTMDEANSAIAQLSTVIADINSQDGSLGKLIHDKSLYTNLEETSNNLSLLLQDLRLNPKRYVNVSVFGKKQKEYTVPEEDPAYKN